MSRPPTVRSPSIVYFNRQSFTREIIWQRINHGGYARELLLLTAYSAAVVGIFLIPALTRPPEKAIFAWAATYAIQVSAALFIIWLFNNRFCRKDFRYAGLRWDRASSTELAAGLAFGATMIGSVFGILLLVGGVSVVWRHPSAEIVRLVPVLIGVQGLQVLVEELVFRTFVLRRLREWMSVWSASLLWGSFFAVLHLLGGDGNNVAAIVNVFAAGTLLNLAYFTAGGSVWLPLGIHFAWNALQMHVFFSQRLFEVDYSGPAWLSGKGNPEASLVSVAIVLLAALAMAWRLRASARAS